MLAPHILPLSDKLVIQLLTIRSDVSVSVSSCQYMILLVILFVESYSLLLGQLFLKTFQNNPN